MDAAIWVGAEHREIIELWDKNNFDWVRNCVSGDSLFEEGKDDSKKRYQLANVYVIITVEQTQIHPDLFYSLFLKHK